MVGGFGHGPKRDNKAVVTLKRGVKNGTLRIFQKVEGSLACVLSVRRLGSWGGLSVMFVSTQGPVR